MTWVKVIDSNDINKIVLQKVSANGKAICIINTEGSLFALSATCPHAGADLSKGWCENGKLVCPFHRYKYDLITGRGAPGQNDYVRTYPVEARADGIYIQIGSWLEMFKALF